MFDVKNPWEVKKCSGGKHLRLYEWGLIDGIRSKGSYKEIAASIKRYKKS